MRRVAGSYQYAKKGSGIWWDIVYRRRPSETRWLTGALVERIYAIERGERPLGPHNLDELAAVAVAHGEPLAIEDGAPTGR